MEPVGARGGRVVGRGPCACPGDPSCAFGRPPHRGQISHRGQAQGPLPIARLAPTVAPACLKFPSLIHGSYRASPTPLGSSPPTKAEPSLLRYPTIIRCLSHEIGRERRGVGETSTRDR